MELNVGKQRELHIDPLRLYVRGTKQNNEELKNNNRTLTTLSLRKCEKRRRLHEVEWIMNRL